MSLDLIIERPELAEYLRSAKSETIDSLYQKSKSIIKKYNDQDDYKLNLIAIDLEHLPRQF